jgi:hypothetical protein
MKLASSQSASRVRKADIVKIVLRFRAFYQMRIVIVEAYLPERAQRLSQGHTGRLSLRTSARASASLRLGKYFR